VHTLPILLGEKRSIKVMTIMSVAGFTILFANIIFSAINIAYLSSVILATTLFAYSLLVLHKNPFSKGIYKKAYKIQAAVGFVIILSFMMSALAK
jgi:4-hydroxybenzoate polyprenyltransferase